MKEQIMKQTPSAYRHWVKKGKKKILKELRNIIRRNADHCNNKLETMKMNQSKLDNSITDIKMISRLNNIDHIVIWKTE